jgi:hypothetical protein
MDASRQRSSSPILLVHCPTGASAFIRMGKSFLTSVYRLKSDIWLLENFDRGIRPLTAWWDGYKSTKKVSGFTSLCSPE